MAILKKILPFLIGFIAGAFFGQTEKGKDLISKVLPPKGFTPEN